MALIIIAGFCSFISMPKEEWPEVTKNTISVITAYPGASPAEIEELVTRPIEEEVGDLSDIENITSFSYEGRSLVQINFTTSANLDRKLLEVQTEVNKVTDLPQNTEDPEIEKYELLFPLLTVGLVGDGHERELNELAQDLQYDFKKVYGVGEVTLAGNRKKEIRVAVDPARLETFGLSLNDVSTALQSKNLNLPGGSLKTAHREILLRTVGKLTAVKEIEKVIIKKNGRAGHTYIKDIARVTESFEDPRVISRLNGRRGITLSIAQSDVGNIVDIVTELKEIALRYRSRLPAKTGIILANDSSIYLEKRLRILYSNGITGFILVGLSLFLFLGFRPALVTAIGIPIAFCGCILCMAIAGMTINSLTLFAMIVVLGMIVDDAIVVTENAYRYIEQGLPAKEAALRGAREMFWPVTAAVATSMAAFLPLLLMAGTLGKVMRQVPQVVIFALAASVWEAFLILPSHLADIAKPLKRSKHRDTGSFRFQKVQDAYAALLRRVVALRYRAVATIVCAAGLIAVIAGGTLDFVLFPNPDFDIFMLRVETDESTRIEQTAEIAAEAEQFLLELPPEEVLSVKSETGRKQTSVGFEFASNITTIEVRLSDYLERTRSGHEIMDDIRRKLNSLANPGLYTLEVLRLGPPVGRPVAVKVLGDDLEILNRLAGKVAEKLESIQGVKDIEHDFRPGKQEIQIVVDGDRAALYGLDVETIARTIRLAYKGAVATTFNDSNEEIDVVVTFNQVTRNDRGRLLDIKVKNPAGALIPLKNVAAAAHTSGYATIK
ncbi:MAG: efflux RND transporter permease subunit, partial [Deltaproteobacteria bacterium]|nr:efflux RND transporter permease subunit [Deltaproteobacteria bacterium]